MINNYVETIFFFQLLVFKKYYKIILNFVMYILKKSVH